MKIEHAPTTHTCCLPRPEPVLRLIADKEAGRPFDPLAESPVLARSVTACVDKQIATGMDIVSDRVLAYA